MDYTLTKEELQCRLSVCRHVALTLLLLLLLLLILLPRHHNNRCPEYIHATCWTRLLTLEPRAQTRGMEDVVTWKLLTTCHHLFSTDDANIVGRCQILRCCIRITRKKIYRQITLLGFEPKTFAESS